jgi:hypothetical protein
VIKILRIHVNKPWRKRYIVDHHLIFDHHPSINIPTAHQVISNITDKRVVFGIHQHPNLQRWSKKQITKIKIQQDKKMEQIILDISTQESSNQINQINHVSAPLG